MPCTVVVMTSQPTPMRLRAAPRWPLPSGGVEFNLADLFESVADAVPTKEALICGSRRFSFAQMDERATRLAHALADRGVGPGDHIGLYLYNGPEYLEGMLAAFKLRAVPININYR